MDKTIEKIDFTTIDWNSIEEDRLCFFFNEIATTNEKAIEGLENIKNKAYNFLAIACGILTALSGLLIAIWGQECKEHISKTILIGIIGFGIVIALLIISLWSRSVYTGKITPESVFIGGYYKYPMKKFYADGIASYSKYLKENSKVEAFRDKFLMAGMIGFLIVPVASLIFFLIF